MYSEDFERCVITREVILRDILRFFLASDLLRTLFMKFAIFLQITLVFFKTQILSYTLIFNVIRQLQKFVTNFQFSGKNSIMYSEVFERCVITREVVSRGILRFFLALDLLQSLTLEFISKFF